MKKILSIILCVCLLATTVLTVPMVSAEEATETEYIYHTNDYESLVGDEEWLTTIAKGSALAVESGDNVISGNKSLKVISDSIGWVGLGLSDATFPKNMNARVSVDYKVTVGTKKWGGVGYIGFSKKQTNT